MLSKIKSFYLIIFTKRNLFKISIIFFIGLTSRFFINYYFNINVFVDCLSFISIIYYFLMSCFVVGINILFDFVDFSYLPTITSILKLFSFKKIHFDSLNRTIDIHKAIKSDFDNIPLVDKIRRRTCWILFDKSAKQHLSADTFMKKYPSYNEYKITWNYDIRILDRIKIQITEEHRKLKIKKDIIKWLLNRRNLNN
jgi:hypothetical protein